MKDLMQLLLAIIVLLLVVGPPFIYPVQALPVTSDSMFLDITLSMNITERISSNLSKTHPYLSKLATILEIQKKANRKINDTNNSPEETPVRMPIVVFDSIEQAREVVKYLKEYIYFYSDNGNNGKYLIAYTSEEKNSVVTYNPEPGEKSIYGGRLKHYVIINLNIGSPDADIDQGFGNPDEIIDAFKRGIEYRVAVIQYTIDDNDRLKAIVEDNAGTSFTIEDYNVFTTITVLPHYSKDLYTKMNKPDQEGGYYYYATAKVSFTVTLTDGEPEKIASASSSDLSERTINITEYVVDAINNIKKLIGTTNLPKGVKNGLNATIDYKLIEGKKYKITTKHSIISLTIYATLTDKITTTDDQGHKHTDYIELFDKNWCYTLEKNVGDIVKDLAKHKADEELRKYYPGGLDELSYPSAEGVSPFLLRSKDGTETPLQAGQPSAMVPITDYALLLTTYPLGASGEGRLTSIKIEHKTQDTLDYSVEPEIGPIRYGFTEPGNGNQPEKHHELTLKIKISPKVVEDKINVFAVPKNIHISIGVKPRVVAKKLEPQVDGETRLIPALAPLGGDGMLTLLQGTMDQFGFETPKKVIDKIESIIASDEIANSIKWLLPTYLPIPMPHRNLYVFAPGEYIGFYLETKKLGIGRSYDALPGIGLLSLIYEEANVTLSRKDVKQPHPDDAINVIKLKPGARYNRITKEPRDHSYYVRMFSLGIGIGKIGGKQIGSRLYVSPSGIGFNQDRPPEMLSNFIGAMLDIVDENKLVGKLVTSIIPKPIATRIADMASQFGASGFYPQLTPYLVDPGKAWAFLMLTPKSTSRFVVSEPGDYVMRANVLLFMLHVKVVKAPLVGIPVPVPIIVVNMENAEQPIMIRNIGVIPLMVQYDIKPPNQPGRSAYGPNSSVGIYAVPVWLDLNDKPMLPVLLRGQYGSDEVKTGLSVVATTSKGLVIKGVSVPFFGMPTSLIKIKLKTLERLMASNEELELRLTPVWANGIAPGLGEEGFKPATLRVARMKTIPLFYWNNKLITYTGVYDPSNKIYEKATELQEWADNTVGYILTKLESAKSLAENTIGSITSLQNIITVLDSNSNSLENRLNELLNSMEEAIYLLAMQTIINIAQGMITQGITALVAAVIPDPTGYLTALAQDIVDMAISYITQLLGVTTNVDPVSIITSVAKQALVLVGVKAAINLLGADVLQKTLDQLKSLVEDIVATIEKAQNGLKLLLQVIHNAVKLAVYKPVLISRVYAYSLDREGINAESILASLAGSKAENITMAIDALGIDGNRGALLVTTPYSTLTFAIQLIAGLGYGDIPNIAVNISGILQVIAIWANFASGLSNDNSESLHRLYDSLISISETINNGLKTVEQWIEVPGLTTNTILMPSTTIIPPSRI